MSDAPVEAEARACPRTGRMRAPALAPGATRPSDVLTAFFAVAVAWLAAAGITAIIAATTQAPDTQWLAFHFAFVGGISQLVVGAGQFFACAFLATEPPSRRTVRTELVLWNTATVAIAVGVPLGITPLTGVGGSLVLAGLVVFAGVLRGMRRRSLQRAPWATRWYLTAALFLGCGAVLGPLMASDVAWTHGSLLGAHLVLNLGGWFGTAIIGTLHTFYPSLTGTTLRRPRLQAPTFAAWSAGIVVLALGAAFDVDGGAVAGWALLLVAGLLLAVNLIASARAGTERSPALVVVSLGQLLLVGALLYGLRSALVHGPFMALVGTERAGPALLLVGGWIGLTVAGSLLHLLALMGRVRRPGPPRRASSRDRVAVGGAGAVALGLVLLAAALSPGLGDLESAGRALVVCGYAALAARILPLATRAVRVAPLHV